MFSEIIQAFLFLTFRYHFYPAAAKVEFVAPLISLVFRIYLLFYSDLNCLLNSFTFRIIFDLTYGNFCLSKWLRAYQRRIRTG